MAEKVGTFDRLWISEDDSSYLELEFLPGPSFGLAQEFLDTAGMRGHRGTSAARIRESRRSVGGTITFAPGPDTLDVLLKWITGSSKSGNNFIPLAASVNMTGRYLRTSRDGTYHLYNGVKVASATFAAAENGPLTVALALVGVDEATSSAPSGATAYENNPPYMMADCTMTVASTGYAFRGFTLTYDNVLDVRFNNSLTASSITAADLAVAIQATFPYGDATALYGTGTDGMSLSAAFAVGNKSFTISCPLVQAPKPPLPFGGRGQVADLPFNAIARKTGSSEIVTFTNDVTA